MECNAESNIWVEPECSPKPHFLIQQILYEAICEQGDWKDDVQLRKVSHRTPGFISQLLSWFACVIKASGYPFLFVASRFNIHNNNKSYSLLLAHWIFCSRSSSLQWFTAYGFTFPPEYLACLHFPLSYDQSKIYPEWHHEWMHAYCFADVAWEPPVLN